MENDESKAKQTRQLAEVWTLALIFPASIAVGYFCGWGLDKLFHSYPWCTAIFTGLGVIAAFVNLFKVGAKSDADDDAGRGDAGSGKPS